MGISDRALKVEVLRLGRWRCVLRLGRRRCLGFEGRGVKAWKVDVLWF